MKKQIFSFSMVVLLWAGWCGNIGLQADDWPLWRGPKCDGSSPVSDVFPKGDFELDTLWAQPIGSAYSSVTIVSGRVLTMFGDGDSDLLGAFDVKTGEEMWRFRFGPMYLAHDGGHDGPVSTPVSDGETVFALGPRGKLVAVSMEDGKQKWIQSVAQDLKARTPFWGFASTPLLHKDLLIVQTGGQNNSGIVAFEKSTGDLRWRVPCGRVDYRSPALTKLAGRMQVVFSDSNSTTGLDPDSGEVLWRHSTGIKNDKTPLPVGDRRVLLVTRSGCQMIEIAKDSRSVQTVWNARQFSGNYDVPVHVDGYLYGFSGRYLTCLDASNGQRTWRSRPPGGKGLIAVDGHLIVLGSKGDVVVVEANPDKYVEKARKNVSDAASYSWPAFADDIIIVRNLKDMAALRPIPRTSFVKEDRVRGFFNDFLNEVAKSDNKQALVDEFMSKQDSFPLVQDDEWVHFLYRGSARDVGISGNMLASGEQDAMKHVPGTDLFYRSYAIEPKARWEYQFVVNFDRQIADPLNPQRTFNNNRVSELVMPGREVPEFVEQYRGSRPGKMTRFQSSSVGQMQVYLPHDYESGDQKHPLLVMLGGFDWLNEGQIKPVLDHLYDDQNAGPVIAFVPTTGERELGGEGTQRFSVKLAERLVPELENRFRVIQDSKKRAIMGKRGASVAAVYTALRHSKVFGNCAAVSYGRADTVRERLVEKWAKSDSEQKPVFHITWNRYEVWRPQSFSCRDQSQQLTTLLNEHGFTVSGGEHPGGSGWGSWRIQTGNTIAQLIEKSQIANLITENR